MTRVAWGLDTPRAEPVMTPCRRDPDLWDIDSGPAGMAAVERVQWAATACEECPLLASCTAAATAAPPRHLCVQAGQVWRGGIPIPVDLWAAASSPGRVKHATKVCLHCGDEYVSGSSTQIYCQDCGELARRADRSWRKRVTG